MNAHYQFHATVHARPTVSIRDREIELAGVTLSACDLLSNELVIPFEVTFEVVLQRLQQLARLDAEPDGFFVFSGGQHAAEWRLNGHLYDRAGRLLYLELKGSCPAASLDAILGTVGWPQQALLFQLVREAVVLKESEFRRYAQRG